mmetsp:Transcript_17140/g.26535  ORF Transcript_17140/g.26535 Transcript_17140/m.26535 type:complete len:430 (+) Transcript_17140:173-1462(+)|eukprot:CAMPEP_0195302102 /NCGR_PEP_ID=MMETSP0707-20130614/30468_1 /TAXON_ID=33640 /ORGANISM="Asterionellopsis glacialis, Strain CCMP134" /LENGTH=429 /DNA_ID=CAMNT_0040365255 /DNA_START=168 /DNA_END=1457 /DNA_ORIENTATION=-
MSTHIGKIRMKTFQNVACRRPASSIVVTGREYRQRLITNGQAPQLRRNLHSNNSSSSSASSSPSSCTTTSNTKLVAQQQQLHSSANISKSATAAALHVLESSNSLNSGIPRPTFMQCKTLFVSSAIPMVGFGFMDNFIMIQAGGYIDATIGVKFGLATMTAAAMGQVVSDVSGVIFGGTLERFLTNMNLLKASNLTLAQRQLPICKNVAMSGAVLGVMLGCCLGASSLMFIDTEIHERQKRAIELKSMLDTMLSDDEEVLGCEECTVYLADAEHIPKEALEQVVTRTKSSDSDRADNLKTHRQHQPQMKLLQDLGQNTLAAKCALYKYAIVDNHYTPEGEGNRSGTSSNSTAKGDYQAAHSILCAPVISASSGKVVAVLEFRNKYARHYEDAASHRNNAIDTSFTKDDERTAKLFARHISIFMDRLTTE